MSRSAIIGFDASKMREGRDQSGYAIGLWLQPSREVRYKMQRGLGGAECIAHDEYGYPITLPNPTRPVFRIVEAGEFEHTPGVTLGDVIRRVAKRGHAWGADVVACDDFESSEVIGTFSQCELRRVIPYAWSAPSKEEAIGTLRRMIREGTLSIAPNDALKREMLGLKFRVTRTGHTEFKTTGKDLVSALISIAHYLNDPDAIGASDYRALPLDRDPRRAHSGGISIAPGR